MLVVTVKYLPTFIALYGDLSIYMWLNLMTENLQSLRIAMKQTILIAYNVCVYLSVDHNNSDF